jgi:gliding motility-associated-like protein
LCLNITEQFQGVIAQTDTAITWQWNFGNNNVSQQQDANTKYTATGNYMVQLMATNKIGCSDTASKNVYVATPPTATAVTDPIIIPSGSGANLNMHYTGNIVSYLWSPSLSLDCIDCPTPFANPRTTTKYTVQVQDKYSCVNKGDITVQVICDNQNFFVPNTFSPNGDGSNDIFYPRGTGLFRIKALRIFNRWGEVVFEKREFQANDPSSGWNGIYKGQKATPDVYVYQIEIYCNNDQLIKFAGNVALIL